MIASAGKNGAMSGSPALEADRHAVMGMDKGGSGGAGGAFRREVERHRLAFLERCSEMFRAYDASASSRTRQEVVKLFGSGDALLAPDREALVALSRSMDRNSPIYNAFIDRLTTVLIGPGMTIRGLNAAARDAVGRFTEWFDERADDRGLSDGSELQHLWTRETCVAGDVLIIRTSDRTLQTIEAERLRCMTSVASYNTSKGERAIDGVVMDERGRPLRYTVVPWDVWGNRGLTETKVEAGYAHLLANRQRPSQTRGTPWLTAAIETISRHEDVLTYVALATAVAASFAVAITSKSPAAMAGVLQQGTQTRSDTGDGTGDGAGDGGAGGGVVERLMPTVAGRVMLLNPEEDIKTVQGSQPQTNFEAYHQSVMRLITAVAGYPLESLTMDYSRANYSVTRMAEIAAAESADPFRRQMVARVLRPIYRWWRAGMIVDGKMRDDPATLEVAWDSPPLKSADPLRDAQTDVLEIGNLISNRDEVARRRGKPSLVSHLDQCAAEKQMLDERGITPVLAPGTKVAPGDNGEEGSAGGKPMDGGEAPGTEDAGGPSPR